MGLHQHEPQMRARDVGGLPPSRGVPHSTDILTSRYLTSSHKAGWTAFERKGRSLRVLGFMASRRWLPRGHRSKRISLAGPRTRRKHSPRGEEGTEAVFFCPPMQTRQGRSDRCRPFGAARLPAARRIITSFSSSPPLEHSDAFVRSAGRSPRRASRACAACAWAARRGGTGPAHRGRRRTRVRTASRRCRR